LGNIVRAENTMSARLVPTVFPQSRPGLERLLNSLYVKELAVNRLEC